MSTKASLAPQRAKALAVVANAKRRKDDFIARSYRHQCGDFESGGAGMSQEHLGHAEMAREPSLDPVGERTPSAETRARYRLPDVRQLVPAQCRPVENDLGRLLQDDRPGSMVGLQKALFGMPEASPSAIC
jgi:hypothetical protein